MTLSNVPIYGNALYKQKDQFTYKKVIKMGGVLDKKGSVQEERHNKFEVHVNSDRL
tara:strand:+ start:216 stop:383 length:168 start_codon:yes stop_codon:yes gene_type:complete